MASESIVTSNPKVVIILSGKRKSGKDYVASLLQKNIQKFVIIRIAGPIKSQYAKMNNLNYEEMLSDSQYKEQHRLQMVTWSTEVRKKDQNYFLRISIEENEAHRYPIWILTDARRQGDIEFFEDVHLFPNNTHLIKIRVTASEECRKRRGYVFTNSIDDAETECGLDKYDKWTLLIENEDLSDKQLLEQLRPIIELCNSEQVIDKEDEMRETIESKVKVD